MTLGETSAIRLFVTCCALLCHVFLCALELVKIKIRDYIPRSVVKMQHQAFLSSIHRGEVLLLHNTVILVPGCWYDIYVVRLQKDLVERYLKSHWMVRLYSVGPFGFASAAAAVTLWNEFLSCFCGFIFTNNDIFIVKIFHHCFHSDRRRHKNFFGKKSAHIYKNTRFMVQSLLQIFKRSSKIRQTAVSEFEREN